MISNFVANLRRANCLVAGGMFFYSSPGHMLQETDLLLRQIRVHPRFESCNAVVLLPPTDMSVFLGEILKRHGVQVIIDPNAPVILREIQLFYPELVFDVGLAHWKLIRPDDSPRVIGDLYPLNFGWALRSEEFMAQTIRTHEAWRATAGQSPLREALDQIPGDPAFISRLKAKKYAVVQIKSVTGNGTARLFPGEVYKPALEFLRDNGYAIVLGGREPMPEVFREFDVWDYPRSPFASPKNDFYLFAHAAVGLVSPSGAGLFCDTLGTPCCQIGSWTLIPHPSAKTIVVPSRLKARATGEVLSFSRQAAGLVTGYDSVLGVAPFNSAAYEDIPPDAEDIERGLREALRPFPQPEHPGQATIRSLDPVGMWRIAASRFSPAFLNRYPEFIG
jgi:putative glycosyltransferase (TIGR04372 family)